MNQTMNRHNTQTAVILGGGLGGLFTGALLSLHGCHVTVLEQSHVVGGGLQTFTRRGLTYETGMHVLGGFQPGGSLYRICRYLGILSELDIRPLPATDMARFICIGDHSEYQIPQGRERFEAYLIEQFPAEAEGIRRYVDSIFQIAAQIDLFNLRQPVSTAVHEAFSIPVGQYLEQFTDNPQLLRLLAFASSLYGGIYDQTPTYVHALINVLYINGSSMFGQSSQQLADALARVITSHGGQICCRERVTAILTERREVQCVVTQSGHEYQADVYISSLHPTATIALCGEGVFPRAYVNRLGSIPNSYSAFKVFYEVKADAFGLLPSPVYLLGDESRLWSLQQYDDTWPQGVALFMTNDRISERGTRILMSVSPMSFDAVRQWDDSTTGHRPEAYRTWSQQQTERVTALIGRHFAGFAEAVVDSFAATPLTFRDWLGAPEGNMFGYSKDAANIMLSHLPIHTKVSNLLLTGQNINLHGICGVPLTAIQTAEAVLGQNVVLDAIHQSESSDAE